MRLGSVIFKPVVVPVVAVAGVAKVVLGVVKAVAAAVAG